MLNVNELQNQIKTGIHNIVVPAIERMEQMKMPTQSAQGDKLAKQTAKTFDDMVTEKLAEVIANAIDYYVKNITITGDIITVGSPISQTAIIEPAPTPMTAGKYPNTLGIS